MKQKPEKIWKGLAFFCLIFGLTSCYVHEKTSSRIGSTYKPSEYTFEIDSIHLKTYGIEKVNLMIRKGLADKWIKDSVTYCTFYLSQKSMKLPIVPFVYEVRFDKKNSLYEITIDLHDIKRQYKTLDSISYKFYDSSGVVFSSGDFNYKNGGFYHDSLLENPGYHLYMPYVIKMNPIIKQTDIFGDIELYLTNINDKLVKLTYKNVRFEYSMSNRTTSDLNW